MELVLPKNYELVSEDEAKQIIGGGKIGFRVYISDGVRNAGKYAGAAIVAGAVEGAAVALNVTGPIGSGVAAGLAVIAGGIAMEAIEHNWEYCDIAINIPFGGNTMRPLYV